jgi:hypothetical protein
MGPASPAQRGAAPFVPPGRRQVPVVSRLASGRRRHDIEVKELFSKAVDFIRLHGICRSMNAQECHSRASECADNAALARVEWIALEFLMLAAQWRAMATRENFLGQVGEQPVRRPRLKALPSIVG